MKTKKNEKDFPLSLKLMDTDEVFTLKGIRSNTSVKELKGYLEYAVGIPQFMQRLSYLDEGDLLDHTDIKANDIVPGAQLRLRIWSIWVEIVKAAALNNPKQLFQLGVTADSTHTTPNSDYLGAKARRDWLSEREFVTLFIASHRGHVNIVQHLIEHKANLNGKTKLGRTALHVAAAQDRGAIVDCLLNNGASVNEVDSSGESALAVAERFGHKDGARHLFLYQWQVRAMETQKPAEVPLLLHQACDTAYPIWLEGTQAQVYFTRVLPPGEFSGTGLGAKKPVDVSTPRYDDSSSANSKSPARKKLEFQEWLDRKEKKEQVDAEKRKHEKEMRELEEEKQKLQSVIDKESFETWMKKQQEEALKGGKKSKNFIQMAASGPAMGGHTTTAAKPLAAKSQKTTAAVESKSDLFNVSNENTKEVKSLEKFIASQGYPNASTGRQPFYQLPLAEEDSRIIEKIRNTRLLRNN